MKKRFLLAIMLVAMVTLAACNKESGSGTSNSVISIVEKPIDVPSTSTSTSTSTETAASTETSTTVSTETSTATSASTVPKPEPENHEGMYRSELTNEWIDESLKDQRPIAVMVDNESTALMHYGTTNSDIVYEMINSTANNRVTRLMCIVKDWRNLEQFGNIRSTRSTNMMLFPEYDAILIHDGGPAIYLQQWYDMYKVCKTHLSAGFARFSNGKSSTYTEYVTSESYYNAEKDTTYPGLISRIEKAKFDTEYTKNYMGKHFTFSDTELSLEKEAKAKEAVNIELPFPHNSSNLKYNEETQTYDYYEYGKLYTDALYPEEERRLSFKNVIIYTAGIEKFDDHGYMSYYAISTPGKGEDGYYITDGYAIPIKWKKKDMEHLTKFTNAKTGEEITLNTGKTYIALVPLDSWKELVIE